MMAYSVNITFDNTVSALGGAKSLYGLSSSLFGEDDSLGW